MTEMLHRSMSASVRPSGPMGWINTIDRSLITAILILFSIGLLLSMAASPPLAERTGKQDFYYVYRHIIFGGLGLIIMITLSNFSPRAVRRWGVFGFFCAAAATFLLPVIGTDFGKGATRWISFGFTTVQPSEFLKPGFAIMIAWLVAAQKQHDGPPGQMIATVVTAGIVVVLALQPDFGQATLIIACFAAILFIGGFPWLGIATIFLVVAMGAQFAYNNSEHVAGRIDSFLSQDIDPRTQIGMAANAISNGGFFGAGVGQGQVKYHLPDAHTDFILAVAAEEYGVLICLLIIAIYVFVTWRAFSRLLRVEDVFIRLAGTGLITIFSAQAMINLGVAARLFPTKGMTLPLISYGGSSMVAIGITLGFLLALTRTGATCER